MPASRRRLGVIFLTVLVDLIGFGIVLPILPFATQRFGTQGLGFGAVVGVFSLMQFVATAVLGRLSDRVGRRPILLATMVVNTVGYCLFAFAESYTVLFLSRVISGFAAGNISAAQAYVADVTPPAERSRGMGLIGAAFGLGFIIGPAIGGFAAPLGHAAPGLVAAGLSLVNFVSAYLILPESLKIEHRVERELWGLGHLAEALARPRLRPLMLVFGIAPFAFAGYTVALPLYTKAHFGWKEHDLAVFFTLVGLTTAFVQGYLFGKLARRVGERELLILGVFGMVVGIGVVPLLPGPAALYGWTVVLAFANSLTFPAANGLVSILSGSTEQGAMLGAAQSFGALGRFAGPPVIGTVYDAWSALPAFLAAGGVMVLAGLATLRLEHISPAVARGTAIR